jgi:hypothetical protein
LVDQAYLLPGVEAKLIAASVQSSTANHYHKEKVAIGLDMMKSAYCV